MWSISLYGVQVTMADKEGAEKACSVPTPVIDGRRANVNLAYLGAKRKTKSQPSTYMCEFCWAIHLARPADCEP